MELETRNIFIDTQYFIAKGLNFDSNEVLSLIDLAKKGSLHVFITDITDLEIVKKIKDQIPLAFAKMNSSDTRVLKSLPLFRKFLATYNEDKTFNFILNQYEKFKLECRVTIVSSLDIKFMNVFQDYMQDKPPFNSTSGKNRKGEFPDAFALAAIKHWSAKGGNRAYLLSGDSDWQQFSDNRSFFHLEDLTSLLDLVIRHEEHLTDLASFADSLINARREKIEKHILQALQNRTYIGLAQELTVEIEAHYITGVKVLGKDILSVGREGAVYHLQFEIHAIFKFWTIQYNFEGDEQKFRGLEQSTDYLQHKFVLGLDMAFSYKDAVPGNFRIVNDQAPSAIEIDYEDGEYIDLKEWALTLPVLVCGVLGGKLTESGVHSQRFKSFEEAVKIFPDLDIYESGKRFTHAMGNKISDELRFETWQAYNFYSS